jgi:diguanylate cyclase (GGDEF)-like protein
MDNWNKNGVWRSVVDAFRTCLWLDDEPGIQGPAERWKTSVLRIILTSALLLCIGLLLIVGGDAWALQKPSIIVACAVFALLLPATLYLSSRNATAGHIAVMAMIYILGFVVLVFIGDPALADFGLIYLYTLPQLAWIFFGVRWAVALMVLNTVPLLLVIAGVRPAAPPFGIDMVVPSTRVALHILLFVFFNVSLPLAFFRILRALQTAAQRNTRANAQLQDSNSLYRDMFEYAAGAALICDPQGRVLQANGKAQRLFRGPLDTEVRLGDLLAGEDNIARAATLIEDAKESGRAEDDFTTSGDDGEPLEIRVTVSALGSRMCLLVAIRNLNPIRKIQRELAATRNARERLSSYDPLTDLPNRAYLRSRLYELAEQQEEGTLLAIASVRLKNARSVNEKYGQAVGDELIRSFSARLRERASATLIPCRLHGVVFSILIPGCSAPDELHDILAPLIDALRQPLEIEGLSILPETATGVAFSRGDIASDELIRRSEHALEAARKSSQNSFMLFNEDFARESHRKIEIEMALAGAIEKAEFSLVYQPKVTASGNITGLEALLRWHSPELGEISPVEFIPLAERTGKIHLITHYVIDAACRQQRIWLDRHGDIWPIAINLSGIDLQRDDISNTIINTAAHYGVEPRFLQIEITETGLIENDVVARDNLEALLKLGFQIAIDDFGTGYSSLKKLSDYSINTIKIDRSFVIGIGENPRSEQIIGLILTLAKYLQCEVVAEGVETADQLQFLDEHGCTQFQGYLFYKPLTVIAIGGLLAERMGTLAS